MAFAAWLKTYVLFLPSSPVRGKQEGATLLTGGGRVGSEGYFIEPTLFTDVKDSMAISREEIFGPVQCVMKWDSIDEVRLPILYDEVLIEI